MQNNKLNILITGAGQGIGKNIAIRLSENEYIENLYILSQSDKIFETEEIINGKKNVIALKGDISSQNFFESLKDIFKTNPPNALVNAAGILGKSGYFDSLSNQDFYDAFRINLIGSMNMIKLISEINEKDQFIKIINFAGGGAAYSYPKFLPYALSKVSVVRMTETLADEFKQLGYINASINCIAPGAVETQMLKEVMANGGTVKTTVSIEEPTNLVEFLLSPESNGITGRFIHSRDDYKSEGFFDDPDQYKLRRND